MQVKNAKFLTSAAREEQFLRPQKPMIAVCGKSNAGKSTLINLLAGQKRLAKTSAAPGRTRFSSLLRTGVNGLENRSKTALFPSNSCPFQAYPVFFRDN